MNIKIRRNRSDIYFEKTIKKTGNKQYILALIIFSLFILMIMIGALFVNQAEPETIEIP